MRVLTPAETVQWCQAHRLTLDNQDWSPIRTRVITSCVLTSRGYGRAFVSRGGWIEFAMVEAGALTTIEAELERRKQ